MNTAGNATGTYALLAATLPHTASPETLATMAPRYPGPPGHVLFCVARGDDATTAAVALSITPDALDGHAAHLTAAMRAQLIEETPRAQTR
ncbi:MAG: hypothetical protein H0U67_16415 [Gemmatimonadetes bacterium]|nr:hypothetical protein [Gemmatimonadota bacterium]